MEQAGHTVISSDLIDRGYGLTEIDFLEHSWLDELRYDAAIFNPPFKHAQAFVEKSLTIAPIVCAFLKIVWLESQIRKSFFAEHPPAIVAVFSKRIPSAINADFANVKGGKTAYAWFIWYKGFKGDPIIKWL